jgi:alkylation response protein AidB-like acyl-CoA dehydrogenase
VDYFFESEHQALRDDVRRFAEHEVRPRVQEMEERRHGRNGPAGESLPTIAVTEPDSDSHVLGMSSTAVRDGDSYVLNGRKWLVGNSHIGHVHGVVARTGPGSRGLTAFLVEHDAPGLRLGSTGAQAGLHGFSYGTLYGRPNLTAVALGIHQAILDDSVAFSRERQLYGEPLAKLPTIAQKLGDMLSRLLTARLTAYHAVHLLDRRWASSSPASGWLLRREQTPGLVRARTSIGSRME